MTKKHCIYKQESLDTKKCFGKDNNTDFPNMMDHKKMSLNNSAMKSLDSSQEIPSTKSNNEISQVEPKMFGNTINKKKCVSNVKSNCSAFNTKKKHSSTSKKPKRTIELKELFGDDREAVKRDKTGIQEIDTEFKNDGFKKVRSRHKRKSEEFLKFGSVKKSKSDPSGESIIKALAENENIISNQTNNDLVPNKKKKNQRKRVKNKERNFQQNINNNNKIGQLTAQDETQILPNQHSEEAKSDHGMDNANYNTNKASKFDTDAIQILNVFSVSQGENVDTNKKTNLETSEPANLTQPIGLSMPILDETIEWQISPLPKIVNASSLSEVNSITSNEEQETTSNSKLDINRNEEITIDALEGKTSSNLSSDKNSRSEPKRPVTIKSLQENCRQILNYAKQIIKKLSDKEIVEENSIMDKVACDNLPADNFSKDLLISTSQTQKSHGDDQTSLISSDIQQTINGDVPKIIPKFNITIERSDNETGESSANITISFAESQNERDTGASTPKKNDLENKVKNMPVSASSITNLSDQEASISSKVNLDLQVKNPYVIPPQAAAEILPELFQNSPQINQQLSPVNNKVKNMPVLLNSKPNVSLKSTIPSNVDSELQVKNTSVIPTHNAAKILPKPFQKILPKPFQNNSQNILSSVDKSRAEQSLTIFPICQWNSTQENDKSSEPSTLLLPASQNNLVSLLCPPNPITITPLNDQYKIINLPVFVNRTQIILQSPTALQSETCENSSINPVTFSQPSSNSYAFGLVQSGISQEKIVLTKPSERLVNIAPDNAQHKLPDIQVNEIRHSSDSQTRIFSSNNQFIRSSDSVIVYSKPSISFQNGQKRTLPQTFTKCAIVVPGTTSRTHEKAFSPAIISDSENVNNGSTASVCITQFQHLDQNRHNFNMVRSEFNTSPQTATNIYDKNANSGSGNMPFELPGDLPLAETLNGPGKSISSKFDAMNRANSSKAASNFSSNVSPMNITNSLSSPGQSHISSAMSRSENTSNETNASFPKIRVRSLESMNSQEAAADISLPSYRNRHQNSINASIDDVDFHMYKDAIFLCFAVDISNDIFCAVNNYNNRLSFINANDIDKFRYRISLLDYDVLRLTRRKRLFNALNYLSKKYAYSNVTILRNKTVFNKILDIAKKMSEASDIINHIESLCLTLFVELLNTLTNSKNSESCEPDISTMLLLPTNSFTPSQEFFENSKKQKTKPKGKPKKPRRPSLRINDSDNTTDLSHPNQPLSQNKSSSDIQLLNQNNASKELPHTWSRTTSTGNKAYFQMMFEQSLNGRRNLQQTSATIEKAVTNNILPVDNRNNFFPMPRINFQQTAENGSLLNQYMGQSNVTNVCSNIAPVISQNHYYNRPYANNSYRPVSYLNNPMQSQQIPYSREQSNLLQCSNLAMIRAQNNCNNMNNYRPFMNSFNNMHQVSFQNGAPTTSATAGVSTNNQNSMCNNLYQRNQNLGCRFGQGVPNYNNVQMISNPFQNLPNISSIIENSSVQDPTQMQFQPASAMNDRIGNPSLNSQTCGAQNAFTGHIDSTQNFLINRPAENSVVGTNSSYVNTANGPMMQNNQSEQDAPMNITNDHPEVAKTMDKPCQSVHMVGEKLCSKEGQTTEIVSSIIHSFPTKIVDAPCQENLKKQDPAPMNSHQDTEKASSDGDDNIDGPRIIYCTMCDMIAKIQCTICKAACYCSIACQKKHWASGHAEICVKLTRTSHKK
ncbi:bromodomain-containing protein DDB_G0270170-like [Ctenocephalides felis]|uniref:bromodomain-containing protein DDB_G0270170-like n=1 Tax=Ctenocephalides felis TaxID=7515 RepID=UPI000E6E174F|nr:bromodomain-containing protein DDB_G0270170-like [Ctenocephalides felis]